MAADFAGLVALSAAIDLLIVLGVLLRGRGRIGLGRCVASACAGGSLWLAKLSLLATTLELGPFAWVTLAYVPCVVVLPLIGAVVLALGTRRTEGGARRATGLVLAGAACALCAAPVGVWSSFIEPRWVELRELDVPVDGARAGQGDIRVIVLADVQTDRIGAHEMRIVERVNALDPDVVIVPGDLFQPHYGLRTGAHPRWAEVRAGFVEFLSGLDARSGVYFVPGNTELRYDWRSLVREAGIEDLCNRVVRVRVEREGVLRDLVLAGTEWNHDSPAARRVRDDLERIDDAEPIVIYATHSPDGAMALPARGSRVDLSVAGHTHGGQVRIPWLGAPMSVTHDTGRRVAGGGLHRVGDRLLYVSRGVGMERGHAPPLRVLCRPEIGVLRVAGASDQRDTGGTAIVEGR